ncbi:hypothetical protein PVAND_007544 [Polypedilum vanderplanki]|uniref:5-formyltetrahydrofolate cyclo-ligase n=1 Tax=Polypedilum vanderplanki TaxID=319348 RepID=A0A9J6C6V8_POLVA|nr:hypothetical protein PVAND_007544 [Polypedilum vanderplanki]
MQNQSKVLLRKSIKSLVQQITPDNKLRQSNAIMEKLLNMSEYKNSSRISIYLSTENEVNTIPILTTMFQQNKQVFVPTYAGSEMKMVKVFDMRDYENLPVTKWKIKQPDPDDSSRENPMLTDPLDLILLPGVAFTRNGDRLGHGMGYYDKYLREYFSRHPNVKNHHKTHLIGLAFEEQIVESLPTNENDWTLDLILTN